MIAEARLELSATGRVPTGAGWFVLNARDAVWLDRGGRGMLCAFECPDGRADFARLGFNLQSLGAGEPMSMYHIEASEQEDFLVLAGDALLIIEGEARRLRPLDLVHCPPGIAHTIVGVGEERCLLAAVGARGLARNGDWGCYPVDPVALREKAGVEIETTDRRVAYARFPAAERTAFREEFLAGFDASSYRDRGSEVSARDAPSADWFVVNARDAPWGERPGRGAFTQFAGFDDLACFSQLLVGLAVAVPGGPIGMYHFEDAQEDFLVLAGEGLAIVEGQERPLRALDLVHCPPGTRHTIIGAGSGPCLVLVVGTLATAGFSYPVDPLAIRHGVGVEEETTDPTVAYRRFAPTQQVPFREAFFAGL